MYMYDNMQLTELRKIAKEKGIKSITKLKKDELIELLKNTENVDKNEETIKEEDSQKGQADLLDQKAEQDMPKEKFVGGNRSLQSYKRR